MSFKAHVGSRYFKRKKLIVAGKFLMIHFDQSVFLAESFDRSFDQLTFVLAK